MLKMLVTIAAFALLLAACGKKAPPASAPAAKNKPTAVKAAAEKPKTTAGKTTGDDPASVSAEVAKLDGKGRVEQTKAMVDQMAEQMKQMVAEVKAAKGDRQKIQEISKRFREYADKHKARGEALSKLMTQEEKAEIKAYASEQFKPLMSEMMTELMAAMPRKGDPAAAANASAGKTAQGGAAAKPAGAAGAGIAPPAGQAPPAAATPPPAAAPGKEAK